MPKVTPLLIAYYEGMEFHFGVTNEFSTSYFGGPLEETIYGAFPNASKLHQIAVIRDADRPDKTNKHMLDLHLLYGLRFSGCEVKYRAINEKVVVPGREHPIFKAGIEISELWPDEPMAGWPYRNYPRHLPYLQIKEVHRKRTKWSEFGETILDTRSSPPAPLVFAMLPPAHIGVSIWGRGGDMEGVAIVWEIDTDTNVVRAYNRCT
jgi:hypothetical protein